MDETVAVNVLSKLLPELHQLPLEEPGTLRRFYAGVGLPSYRPLEYGLTPGGSPRSYKQMLEVNPLYQPVDLDTFVHLYPTLRQDALELDPDALNDLGWIWLNGRGTAADPALARRLFLQAVEAGSGQALLNLGAQVDYGRGCAVDFSAAIGWYTRAFEDGVPEAAVALGNLYSSEEMASTPGAKEQAVAWFRKAAELDAKSAYLSLGLLLIERHTSYYNLPEGLFWLQASAMRDEIEAAWKVADIYHLHAYLDPNERLHQFWSGEVERLGRTWTDERCFLDW